MKFLLTILLIYAPVQCAKAGTGDVVIKKVCERMKYEDCSLVKAIITIESGNNPLSIGHDGAGSLGLMQIKCSTARVLDKLHGRKALKCNSLFDPYTNVKYGIEYLNYIKDRLTIKPTMHQLLSVYNGGFLYHRPTNSYSFKRCNAISIKKKRECKKGEPFNVQYSRKVIDVYLKIKGS